MSDDVKESVSVNDGESDSDPHADGNSHRLRAACHGSDRESGQSSFARKSGDNGRRHESAF